MVRTFQSFASITSPPAPPPILSGRPSTLQVVKHTLVSQSRSRSNLWCGDVWWSTALLAALALHPITLAPPPLLLSPLSLHALASLAQCQHSYNKALYNQPLFEIPVPRPNTLKIKPSTLPLSLSLAVVVNKCLSFSFSPPLSSLHYPHLLQPHPAPVFRSNMCQHLDRLFRVHSRVLHVKCLCHPRLNVAKGVRRLVRDCPDSVDVSCQPRCLLAKELCTLHRETWIKGRETSVPRRHGRRSAQSQKGLTHLADQPAGMERIAASPDDSRVSTLALAFESLPSFTPLCLSWFAVLPRLTGLPRFPCAGAAEDSTCPSAFHLSSPRYMGPLYDSLGSGGTDMETSFDAARCLLSRSALVLSSRAPIVTACHRPPRAQRRRRVLGRVASRHQQCPSSSSQHREHSTAQESSLHWTSRGSLLRGRRTVKISRAENAST